ncbi:Uncharacterised protein [Legionella beliardensis]|uniref:Uncharacterized protein n=2 Tax=Legionella beliardensis TaxID=91822 RepID=A0A378HYH6_9GAMM|nr:Uncharacterised protein [Legionella beliardensis]
MADALNPNYTNDSDLYNNYDSSAYDDDDDDTLQNGEPLSADSAEMTALQPFMLDDSDEDEDSDKKKSKSQSNPLDQYDMDLGSQNMEMDPSQIGEVVAENPELLMAL